jgi:hypothetical protein
VAPQPRIRVLPWAASFRIGLLGLRRLRRGGTHSLEVSRNTQQYQNVIRSWRRSAPGHHSLSVSSARRARVMPAPPQHV